jgi:signal transduction histidine kinase
MSCTIGAALSGSRNASFLTSDIVSLEMNAVVYFRAVDATTSVVAVESFRFAVGLASPDSGANRAYVSYLPRQTQTHGTMRLADFIEANTAPILAEWVAFAQTCAPVAAGMDVDALRDDAAEMLTTIIADLRTPQTKREQADKSKGNSERDETSAETPAEVHGAGRAGDGFTVGEMVAEYRALRASVIRLWTAQCGTLTGSDLEDLMRFNEAIDQSTAESVTRYTSDIEESKEMFLAILGHDLRSPLNAVIMASQFMIETEELGEPHRTLTTRILRSGRRMNQLVGDLLDFTRSRLGPGLLIAPRPMDLAREGRLAVEEASVAHPGSVIQFTTSGDVEGKWDCPRISQVLSNLLGNAVQHGWPGAPITLDIRGERDAVAIQVHNRGPTVPDADHAELFSPFKRLRTGEAATSPTASLGLGLYIVDRIVAAHNGSISVESSDEAGTVFTVRLPR